MKKEGTDLGVITTEEIEPMIPKVVAKLQPKSGLYLVKPHGEMIATGEKTLIVKSKKFTSHVGEPLFLLEDKLCWGIITLKEPKEITPVEFEKLRDKHKISDKEAFEHWGWKKERPLYSYEFIREETFDPPLPVKLPQGIQVFVDAKNIKFPSLKSLSILELFDYADMELADDLYAEIVEELFNRNFFKSQVFELIRGWISDYNVNSPNDKQLGDDYRVVLSWYSSIKKGKKLFKRVGEEKKEISLDDCRQLGLKIFREMKRRGFTFNRPETYKENARELFKWIISQVGEKNVPFKGANKEEKATTIPEPSKIERPDLENIDDIYVQSLSDSQLIALHARLHELFKKIGKVTEGLQNAHTFVWAEMRKRKLKHNIEDELDRATSLEVVEYPAPEEGIPQQISLEELAKKINLERVLKAFPDTILIDDPIHVYLCGRVVNEGEIPPSHDLDLLFKQGWYHVPTVNAFLDEVSKKDPEVARRFHFVWDSLGPHIGFTVPVYRLAFIRVSPDEMRRTSPFEFLAGATPQVMKPFIGMKPKSGFEKNEFWDVKEMWEKWAKNYIDKGICVKPETKVWLNPLPKNIEDVEPGDLSLGLGKSKVLEKMERSFDGNLIRIKAKGLLPVSITPEHPVLAVRVPECKWGNRKCRPNCRMKKYGCTVPSIDYTPRWVEAKDLTNEDFVLLPRLREEKREAITLKRTKHDQNRTVSRIEITPDLMELLGWYMAEGSWSPTGTITWSLGKHEKDEARRISYLIQKLFGLKVFIKEVKTALNIQVNNTRLLQLFKLFGKNAREKRIPKFILEAPTEDCKHFINAWYLGDGSNANTSRQIVTASEVAALQLAMLCTKLGDSFNIHKRKQVQFSNNFIYRISIFSSEKHSSYWKDENFYYLPIKISKESYSGPVYNLETRDHTYSLGFIVHNCVQKKFDGMRFQCVKEGTPVFGSSKLIEEVKVGEPVYGRTSETKVKNTFVREYDGEMINFKVRGIDVSLTPEHPILAQRSKRCVYKNHEHSFCNPHCRLTNCGSRKPRDFELDWIKARDLGDNPWVFVPKIKRPERDLNHSFSLLKNGKFIRNKIFTELELSDEFLEVLGWFIAEGSANDKWGNISFALSDLEEKEVRKIKELGLKIFNINLQMREKNNGIELYGRSKTLAKFLDGLAGHLSHNKHLPWFSPLLSERQMRVLLEAYVKGDGHKGYSIHTSSKQLAYQVFESLLSFGILPTFTRSTEQEKIISGVPTKSRESFTVSWYPGKYGFYHETRDGFYVRAKVSSEHYSGKVYNLETTEGMYSLPFVVHNCHVKGDQIKIFTEDRQRDRASVFKKSVKELLEKKKAESFILDSVPSNSPIILRDSNRMIDILPISDLGEFREKGLERVKSDYEVLSSWKSRGQWTKIRYVLRHPFKGTLKRIKTVNSIIDTSPNHSIFLEHNRYPSSAKFLKVGQHLSQPFWHPQVIRWKFRLGSLDFGKALGLFLAEGSCSFENAKKGNWLVSLSMTKKNLVSFVKKEFESFFGCQFSVLEDGTKITTSDKGLFLWLAENFYTRNKLKKIPKFVYNSDKDYQRMFLEGYYLGDGHVYPDGRIEIADHSPVVITGILYLERLLSGRKGSASWRKDKDAFQFSFNISDEERYPHKMIRTIADISYSGYLYDLETEDHSFRTGIGEPTRLHNTEMVEYACGAKETNRPDLCDQVPREQMIKWIGAEKKALDDENVVFHVHDCTFVDGQAINEKGYVERWEAIKKVFGDNLKHWRLVEGSETSDMRGFFSLVKKYRALTNSEGVVAKSATSTYPIKYSGENRASDWAKLKNLKEVDVKVWKVIQKKTSAGKPLNQWIYECIFAVPCTGIEKYREKDVVKREGKCYLWIGRSYGTGEKVSPGTIIIVRPIRVSEFEDPKGKIYYSVAPNRIIPIKTQKGVKLLTFEELFESIPGPSAFVGSNEAKRISGLETITWNGKEFHWSPILGVSRHLTNGELIKITQRGCELELTPGHSLFDTSGNLVDVEKNPEVKVCRSISRIGELEELEISLKGYERKGNKLFLVPTGVPFTQKNYSHSNKFVLAKYQSETLKALMRFLGAYASEGSASRNQTSYRVRISQGKKEWLQELVPDIELISNAKLNWELVRSSNTWNLVLWSRPLFDLVVSLCGKGSRNKTIPEEVFSLKKEFQDEFLRKLSEGDGTTGRGLNSISRKLLSGISLLYALNGQNFSISPNHSCLRIDPVKYWQRMPIKKYISKRRFSGYTYDVQTIDGNFVDGVGLGLCKNTWMFPYYDGKHPAKSEPDSIDVIKKLVAIGTGPTKEQLSTQVFNLPLCPFWEDEKICILKERFKVPRDDLSKVVVEYLKFPIVCKFANHYRCRFVKSYYYSYKTFETNSVTDEEDLSLQGEED